MLKYVNNSCIIVLNSQIFVKLLIECNKEDDIMNTKNNPTLTLPIKGRERIAFTLTEVLITLGIIGVVSAMTIDTEFQKSRCGNQIKKSIFGHESSDTTRRG